MKPIIIALFFCLISIQNYALAPVVDDSENFAMLDGQQAEDNQPVTHQDYAESSFDEQLPGDEKPLAHEEPSLNNQSQVELLDKIQGMQQDLQELRGQLEMQSHELKVLKDQQLTFYNDLDARLRQTPSTEANTKHLSEGSSPSPSRELTVNPTQAPSLTTVTAPTFSTHHNPADEQISYMAAYELVKNKQFDDAIHAMHAFITQYPNGGYTANAQYWLGELYMVKKNYPEAIQHFEVVLNQYPTSSKTAASLLKIGYALASSGKESEAKQKLYQVVKNYPDTGTAQLAADKLKSLNAS